MQLVRSPMTDWGQRPSRHNVAAPRNAEIIDAGIRRAPAFAIVHERNAESGRFDHGAERLSGRTAIVFQKHDHSTRLEKAADRPKKTSMKLPVFVVETQL